MPRGTEAECHGRIGYVSAKDPTEFHVFEVYKNEAAVATHMQSTHFTALKEALKDALEGEINGEMGKLLIED